jgi:hypothetical protein
MEREPHWIKGIDRVSFVVNDKRNVTGKHMDVLFAAGAAVRDAVSAVVQRHRSAGEVDMGLATRSRVKSWLKSPPRVTTSSGCWI